MVRDLALVSYPMFAMCGAYLVMMLVLVDEESACVSFAKRADIPLPLRPGCRNAHRRRLL